MKLLTAEDVAWDYIHASEKGKRFSKCASVVLLGLISRVSEFWPYFIFDLENNNITIL